MPIKPENRDRYPDNWPDVRAETLKRAELDGVPSCEMRGSDGKRCATPNGATIIRAGFRWSLALPGTGTRVVLTTAHLDQTPEHNDPSNLLALCQRCHLTYDATFRRLQKQNGERPTVAEALAEWRKRYA